MTIQAQVKQLEEDANAQAQVEADRAVIIKAVMAEMSPRRALIAFATLSEDIIHHMYSRQVDRDAAMASIVEYLVEAHNAHKTEH